MNFLSFQLSILIFGCCKVTNFFRTGQATATKKSEIATIVLSPFPPSGYSPLKGGELKERLLTLPLLRGSAPQGKGVKNAIHCNRCSHRCNSLHSICYGSIFTFWISMRRAWMAAGLKTGSSASPTICPPEPLGRRTTTMCPSSMWLAIRPSCQ